MNGYMDGWMDEWMDVGIKYTHSKINNKAIT